MGQCTFVPLAGVYIHIPFCRKACTYCDFHFSTSLSLEDDMVEGILREMKQRGSLLNDETVETIYFGGGTPSVLKLVNAERLINEVFRKFSVSESPEITFETNPEDINSHSLRTWKAMGINRLSIGVQSFHDSDLHWMNRVHNAEQSMEAIDLAVEGGFENINIDLIYGLPDMQLEQWKFNVETFLQCGVNHLSAYHLTVEEKTLLHHNVKTGKQPLPSEGQSIKEVEWLESRLNTEGWERYEISNFCKDKKYAKHNTNYWTGRNYIGFGPSAHSFFGNRRSWNIKNNHQYLKLIEDGQPYFEIEDLSKKDQVNEAIMLGLRTQWGIDREKINQLAERDYWSERTKLLDQLIVKSWIDLDDGRIILSSSGRLFADHIASELFWSK